MPAWFTKLTRASEPGAPSPRPTTVNEKRTDASARSWLDAMVPPSGAHREVKIEGCSVVDIVTIRPMTREQALREADCLNCPRPQQWRRVWSS
jgi:hypothetical protein